MSQCLASVTRRAAAPTRIIRRHIQSDAKKPAHTLSPHKMRALISLYHQSDTFIREDNLSTRIDLAFTQKAELSSSLGYYTAGLDTLRRDYERIRHAPKFSEMRREKESTTMKKEQIWSQQRSHRDWKVIEALYGVDASDGRQPMPGLEALEEHISKDALSEEVLPQSEAIQKEIEEDAKSRT